MAEFSLPSSSIREHLLTAPESQPGLCRLGAALWGVGSLVAPCSLLPTGTLGTAVVADRRSGAEGWGGLSSKHLKMLPNADVAFTLPRLELPHCLAHIPHFGVQNCGP